MIVDNPAARLFSILEAGKQKKADALAREIWHDLLNVPPESSPLLIKRIAEVMELPGIISDEMNEHFPDERETVAYWRGQVNKAFKELNLNNTWNHFISGIDQHSMSYLRQTAKLLQVYTKFKPVAGSDLNTLREKVDTLIVEFRESDLDDDLKLSVLKYLNQLLSSIDEYFITGVTPILDAVNASYGRAFTDASYRDLITGHTTLGDRLRAVLDDAATVTTIAANLHEIAPVLSAGWKLLTGT